MTSTVTGLHRGGCTQPPVSTTGTRPGWVLVMCDPDGRARLVADDARPRHWSGLTRTRIAPTETLVAHLGEAVRASLRTGQPQAGTTVLASGRRWRTFTVPVAGAAGEVVAVQAWGGPRSAAIPPRPPIGSLLWAPGSSGIAVTSAVVEQLLDTGHTGPRTRALPDLLAHLDHLDDREQLLGLFDPETAPTVWSGLAATAGRGGGERRSLWICARSDGNGAARSVTAAAVDVSTAHPPPDPELATRLVRALPLPERHAVGVVDLATGLVHQWLRPGPDPLHRWVTAIPEVHPDDRATLEVLRAELRGGRRRRSECQWRLRFGTGTPWLTVRGTWTRLPGPHPQAVLDVRVPRTRTGKDPGSRA